MNELRLFDPLAVDPFEDTFRSLMRPWRMEAMETPRIKLDLHELDTSYTVKAEIPGVRKEDIDVRVDGNTVTISAEVKKEKEEKKEGRVLRREAGRLCQPQLHAGLPGERGRGRSEVRERCALADAAEEGGRVEEASVGAIGARPALAVTVATARHDPTAVRPRSSVHRGRPKLG